MTRSNLDAAFFIFFFFFLMASSILHAFIEYLLKTGCILGAILCGVGALKIGCVAGFLIVYVEEWTDLASQ